MPFASIIPQGEPAHAAPCTSQTTSWLPVPRTLAVNAWTAPGANVTLAGNTVT